MVSPDVVVSSPTVDETDFEDYAYLQRYYLETQIRPNKTLPEGMTLRGERRRPRIALWPALKEKLEDLYRRCLHGERYRLLKLLRAYETYTPKFGDTIPKDLLTPGLSASCRDADGQIDDEEIQEIIEIDHDSNEIIEIDDDESTNEDGGDDNHGDNNGEYSQMKKVASKKAKTTRCDGVKKEEEQDNDNDDDDDDSRDTVMSDTENNSNSSRNKSHNNSGASTNPDDQMNTKSGLMEDSEFDVVDNDAGDGPTTNSDGISAIVSVTVAAAAAAVSTSTTKKRKAEQSQDNNHSAKQKSRNTTQNSKNNNSTPNLDDGNSTTDVIYDDDNFNNPDDDDDDDNSSDNNNYPRRNSRRVAASGKKKYSDDDDDNDDDDDLEASSDDDIYHYEDAKEEDAEKSIESNTGPATVVPSSLVVVKKEEQEVMTPRQPLQIVARSKATNPTRPDHITLRPRRTKTRKPRMKQEEEQQNHDGPTNTTNSSKPPTPTASIVPDAVDVVASEAAVVTGTNEKRKSKHQSRDHLKRKKSKSSIQSNKNNSTMTNLDDDDMNDRMYGDDDDNDNYYDNNDDDDDDPEIEYDDDSDNSGVVTTETTTTTSGKKAVPNKQEKKWNEMYIRLIAYNNTYQSTCVPSRCEDDPGLGNWVRKQRQLYNKNKLTKDRINRLNSIGFVWNLLNPSWNEMYERLVAYKDQYGSTCVPNRYEIDSQLGMWVSHQRRLYNTNELPEERINQLNSIDFVWNARDARWMEMYARLVAYKEKHNSTCVPRSSTNVPVRYKQNPQLGEWVSTQRLVFKKNTLSTQRVQLLDSIGFFNPLEASGKEKKWMEMYHRLCAYKQEFKSTKVPYRYEPDPQLGEWVKTQRTKRSKKQRTNYNKLTKKSNPKFKDDRIDRLNSIGFVWKVMKK